MKKIINILLIVILILGTTACKKSEKELTDAEKFKKEYESLNNQVREKDNKKIREVTIPSDNPIVYKSAEGIVKMIDNKESFLVYFGFSDCPWCRSVIEELIKVSKDNSVAKIYYVDVKDIRDTKEIDTEGNIKTTQKGSKGYNELLKRMSNVLADYKINDKNGNEIDTNEKRIFAPNVVAISKGKAIELATGESTKLKNPYDELTDEMRKETYNKFKCLIECLDKESTTCQKNSC